MKIPLLTCPFCGEAAVFVLTDHGVAVECTSCRVRMEEHEDRIQAAEAWNRRDGKPTWVV